MGGAPHILSYMTRLQVGKEKLDCDFSQLKLHHVPFEITYMSNVTRLNLDDNKLKDLWPVAPLPPFTGGQNHTRSSFSTCTYSILFGSSLQRNARLAVPSLSEEQILSLCSMPASRLPWHISWPEWTLREEAFSNNVGISLT